MKLAIVVGHNRLAQGAVRTLDGRTEYDWNSELAAIIEDIDPENIEVFLRTPGGGYSAEIDRVYAQVNEYDPECSIELHFNSVASPLAKGCLTLSSGTKSSLSLAAEVQARMLGVMGNEDDGIHIRRRHDRGGRSLWQGRAPAIMTEPYFGSNRYFSGVADQHMDELAEAIYFGAKAFVAGDPTLH